MAEGDIARLLAIMAALRDPRSGCPWDVQQDFASIAPYTIEEAYEVADAIGRGEIAHRSVIGEARPGEALTEEEVRAFCQGQIAHYKIPRYIRFRDSLPMTVTGKPQKFIMRDAMVEELGASRSA